MREKDFYEQLADYVHTPEVVEASEKRSAVAQLIVKHLKNTITSEESKLLAAWVNESEPNRLKFEDLLRPDYLMNALSKFQNNDKKATKEKIDKMLFGS